MPIINTAAARTICKMFDGLAGDDTANLDSRRAAVAKLCKATDITPTALQKAVDMVHEAANLPWPDPRIYEG
jgi:hypothetical protein